MKQGNCRVYILICFGGKLQWYICSCFSVHLDIIFACYNPVFFFFPCPTEGVEEKRGGGVVSCYNSFGNLMCVSVCVYKINKDIL